MPIPGIAVASTATGLIFLWSAIKGASLSATLRDLISGKQPTGTNVNPVTVAAPGTLGAAAGIAAGGAAPPGFSASQLGALGGAPGAKAQAILTRAAAHKGQPYCFGGGHSGNPCAASCTDCSGYVSCVLNEVGAMHGSMATGGLAGIGKSVPYSARLPGDIIVWNGGSGGGHCGIIIDGSTMWNNPCTKCGGVQIGHYPTATRTAGSAVIRRV